MARKKKHPEHENHERWLISYADFITLLFAFFVVMFASSQADKKKAQQVSESVKTALEKGAQASSQQFVPRGREDQKGKGGAAPADDKNKDGGIDAGDKGGTQKQKSESPQAAAADLVPSMNTLNVALAKEIQAGKIEVHMEQRGLVVSLHEGGFFPSGDDKIIPASYASVAKIAVALNALNNPVRLEGHTDSVPIHTGRFSSNWELSAARSIAMLNLLSDKYAIPRQRCGIAGYADTAPVDTNNTAEGRARNRRVDIVVLNAKAAEENKPVAAPAGSTPGPAPATPAAPAAATPAKASTVPPAVATAPKPSPVPPPAPKSTPKTVARK